MVDVKNVGRIGLFLHYRPIERTSARFWQALATWEDYLHS